MKRKMKTIRSKKTKKNVLQKQTEPRHRKNRNFLTLRRAKLGSYGRVKDKEKEKE